MGEPPKSDISFAALDATRLPNLSLLPREVHTTYHEWSLATLFSVRLLLSLSSLVHYLLSKAPLLASRSGTIWIPYSTSLLLIINMTVRVTSGGDSATCLKLPGGQGIFGWHSFELFPSVCLTSTQMIKENPRSALRSTKYTSAEHVDHSQASKVARDTMQRAPSRYLSHTYGIRSDRYSVYMPMLPKFRLRGKTRVRHVNSLKKSREAMNQNSLMALLIMPTCRPSAISTAVICM